MSQNGTVSKLVSEADAAEIRKKVAIEQVKQLIAQRAAHELNIVRATAEMQDVDDETRTEFERAIVLEQESIAAVERSIAITEQTCL